MIRTLTLFAAAVVLATPAVAAGGREVTATYNPQTRTYCILHAGRDATDPADSPIYRKPCRTAAQWRVHGVRFDPPVVLADATPAR